MKAAHWYIDFVSRKDTQYRIYIYDNYEGSVPVSWPVRLIGGEAPITTDEDGTDDMFTNIRTSTGVLRICTQIPDGSTLDISDLLPVDNIDRHVRLVTRNGSTETVVWSGFLSSEMLKQPYTGRPDIIDLGIQSTMQAADSVEIRNVESVSFATMLKHIAYCLRTMNEESGLTLFRDIYISARYYDIIRDKYIYNNSYFESRENVSGDNVYIDVHSISIKNIISQIAGLFGMTVREDGMDIYMTDERTVSYKKIDVTTLCMWLLDNLLPPVIYDVTVNSALISDMDWVGCDHTKTVTQGAKRVSVSSKLKDFECNLVLLETPKDNLASNPQSRWTRSEVYANTNNDYYSHIRHQTLVTKMYFPTDLSTPHLDYLDTTLPQYDKTIFWTDNDMHTYYEELVVNRTKGSNTGIDYHIGSYMALWRDGNGGLQNGLMVCGFPQWLIWSINPIQGRSFSKFAVTQNHYVFKNTTPLTFAASEGYVSLDIGVLKWFDIDGAPMQQIYGAVGLMSQINVAIRLGNKWATYDLDTNETGWSNTFTTFMAGIEQTEGTYKIHSNWQDGMPNELNNKLSWRIDSLMVGTVSVYIFPFVYAIRAGGGGNFTCSLFDVLISKLTLDYVPEKHELQNERSENSYIKETGSKFQEEKEISLDIASYANNKKMASLVWNSQIEPCRLMTIAGTETRPELDILQRAVDYYRKSRTTIELSALAPDYIKPYTKITGYEGKTYINVAQSRNWVEETGTLTCMETPT